MLIRLIGRILYAVISAVIFVFISSTITSQQCGFLPPQEGNNESRPNENYPDWREQQRRAWELMREQAERAREALRRHQEQERTRYGDSDNLRRHQRGEWEKLEDSQRSERRDYYRNRRYAQDGDHDNRDNSSPRQ